MQKNGLVLSRLPKFICLFAPLFVSACTNPGGGGDDSSSSGGSSSSSRSSSDGAGTTTKCGAVSNSVYINPISASDGIAVSFISANGPNLVAVQGANTGPILVRLHGLSASSASPAGIAQRLIQRFSSNGLFFVSAGASCIETVAGGQAQIGSLFNSAGEGLAEYLASTGSVNPNTADTCEGAKIGVCLKALAENPPASATSGELPSLLWKPLADSDGRLAVHTGPYGTTVVVNGEVGENQGSGNGYGSLARFGKPGCSYGNARVKVFSGVGLPYTVGGKATFSIPNGCGRYCVDDSSGNIVTCVKQ